VTKNKNVKGWLLLAVIFVVVPGVGLTLLWKDRCVVQNVSTVSSPDGAWSVRVDHKDCGPAMKVATEVRVAEKDAQDGELVMLLHGPHAVEATWGSPQSVSLKPPKDATIVSKKTAAGPVAVTIDKPM
jgi:hypothetical protein